MKMPFWKAHGAGNDFLFTFTDQCALPEDRLGKLAVAICDRVTGVGADGWYLVDRPGPAGAHAKLRLFNSDGSPAELSGNGTRCAAAILLEAGLAGDPIRIATGAGLVELRLRGRAGSEYQIETKLGGPSFPEGEAPITLAGHTGLVVDVGNPQFAVAVPDLDFDWRTPGKEIEGLAHFPARTNVSFYRKLSDNTIEARFYERGAGPTRSSGTGSVGASVAAIRTGLVQPPVEVVTEGGRLQVDWTFGGPVQLTGPAVVVAQGMFITTLN